MAESNKNQTAAERARLKEALGSQLTNHMCASPTCPTPSDRITHEELYPVVTLARMDRALLRSAIGEVLHSPTPARVAIAEWVELARIYSGDPMRRLMNGVLGRIAAGSNGA